MGSAPPLGQRPRVGRHAGGLDVPGRREGKGRASPGAAYTDFEPAIVSTPSPRGAGHGPGVSAVVRAPHRAGDDGPPGVAVEVEPGVQPGARALGVVEGERDERGGDESRHAIEHDADGLRLVRGLVGGTEREHAVLGQDSVRQHESPGPKGIAPKRNRRNRPGVTARLGAEADADELQRNGPAAVRAPLHAPRVAPELRRSLDRAHAPAAPAAPVLSRRGRAPRARFIRRMHVHCCTGNVLFLAPHGRNNFRSCCR